MKIQIEVLWQNRMKVLKIKNILYNFLNNEILIYARYENSFSYFQNSLNEEI